MDYLKMIFRGYADPSIREYLSNYLYREFKKAEKDHYEPDEFFDRCNKVVDKLENRIKKQYYEREEELQTMLGLAKKGMLIRDKENPETNNLTEEELKSRTITYCESELASLDMNAFGLNMLSLSKGIYGGHLWHNELIDIRVAINKAYQKQKETHANPNQYSFGETSSALSFFDSIRDDTITDLEVQNYVEQITDNYKPEKLEMLYADFGYYFFLQLEDRTAKITKVEINEAKNDLNKKKKPIPYLKPIKFENNKSNSKRRSSEKIIDVEKLIFPYEFTTCYQFQNFLENKIKEQSVSDTSIKSGPVMVISDSESTMKANIDNDHRLKSIEYAFISDLPKKIAWLNDLKDEVERLKKLKELINTLINFQNEYIEIHKLKINFYDGELGEIVDLKSTIECSDDKSKKEFNALFIYAYLLVELKQSYLKLLEKLKFLYPERVKQLLKEKKPKVDIISGAEKQGKIVKQTTKMIRLGVIHAEFTRNLPEKLKWANEIKDDVKRLDKLKQVRDHANDLFDEYAKIEQLPIVTSEPESEMVNRDDIDLELVSKPGYDESKKKQYKQLSDYFSMVTKIAGPYHKLYKKLSFQYPERIKQFDVNNGMAENQTKPLPVNQHETISIIQKEKSKPTLKQIALKCFYENNPITRENGTEIAKQYGNNSGEALYHDYTYFSNSVNRKGDPGTKVKLKNRIKLQNCVVDLLSGDSKKQAEKDLQHLKNLYNEHYQ